MEDYWQLQLLRSLCLTLLRLELFQRSLFLGWATGWFRLCQNLIRDDCFSSIMRGSVILGLGLQRTWRNRSFHCLGLLQRMWGTLGSSDSSNGNGLQEQMIKQSHGVLLGTSRRRMRRRAASRKLSERTRLPNNITHRYHITCEQTMITPPEYYIHFTPCITSSVHSCPTMKFWNLPSR